MDFANDRSPFRTTKTLTELTRDEMIALKEEAKKKMERLEKFIEEGCSCESQRILFAMALGIERSLYADVLVLLDSPGVGLTKWALTHYSISHALLMEVAQQGLADALRIKREKEGGRL